jgi:endonuclease/exonuclease/phosphatase family metal-dependent hydrolase
MRILTWNLFHGRAEPPARRPLLREFCDAIAGWEWDVALLQEVPPWWPPPLAHAAGAQQRSALTSRNQLLALRRRIAERWPDVIKSNGGGANTILVRGATITDHRVRRLRLFPERRVMHAVALGSELWIGNLHAQAHWARWADSDVAQAGATILSWSDGGPAILGGDFNDFRPQAEAFVHGGGHRVDHVLVHGLRTTGNVQVLAREPLSDHAPIVVEVGGG